MGSYVAADGEFNRDTNYITTRITADGGDGYPVEAGRYRLIVARACPWANRTIIVRRLLGSSTPNGPMVFAVWRSECADFGYSTLA